MSSVFSSSRRRRLPWLAWLQLVRELRPACRRQRTFLWMILVLAAFCLRPDLAGVASFMRALHLSDSAYDCLLWFFHSPALSLDLLTHCWLRAIQRRLWSRCVRVQGRPVAVVDGLKRPKEGLKMPGVKHLHQESSCNAKAPFIMGHSCQAVGLLVRAADTVLALPVAARIHEGLVWSNRDRRTLLDKLRLLLLSLPWGEPLTVVADAYYAAGRFARRLLEQGHHLVTRVRSNAVAFHPAVRPKGPRRGRPALYGAKTKLRHWFSRAKFQRHASPLYDDLPGVTLQYCCRDLLWRPLAQQVRFVWVIHPTRGRLILMTTDLKMDPLEVIRLYGWRMKIEVSFKQAIHTVGAYAYHFWMRAMRPIRRGIGNQHLHRASEGYRAQVRRKLGAYQRHIQLGLIAQGLLQCLALRFRHAVWANFQTYIRTAHRHLSPSEWVVAHALRQTWPHFLEVLPAADTLKKFLVARTEAARCPYLSALTPPPSLQEVA
jgi:hypothetical protein